MPSSITLTVSHLPTSTSFFLTALQPLGYAYRGRSGQTIGFGPENSKAPADFWITQEVPGIPAGAAHVAFPAASHAAVQNFFTSSLKAGAKIYGEPATRDQYGYYSAAIIDFDGNSIEAVYRPGLGEENKENDVRSLVSQKSTSRDPTVITKAPTPVSKPTSVLPPQAPTSAPRKSQSPPKGDALDRILNEARNTANVARNLVDQVRPNLNSSQSSPATPQPSNNNKGPSDAIVGTLLGVAAGAALHYAFNSRSGSNSDPEDGGRRRPSVTRSNTSPNFHDHRNVRPYAIEPPPSSVSRSGAGGRYITMEDNDYASTIRPSSRTRSRRGSVDSGIGISPPSTSSKSSRKMLEAPPSSYRTPTVLTSAESRKPKRSSSQSRVSSSSRPHSSRRRSSAGEADVKTILHIRETVRRGNGNPSPEHSTTSKYSKASTVRPEKQPLPPSRAATWGGGGSEASFATAHSRRSSAKTVMGKMGVNTEASSRKMDLTRSVVGKVKGTKRLDVPGSELGPEDSVSQVSSIRGSRRSSRR